MTTFDPGARLVLTHGLLRRPRSTAFCAMSAAATITDGFDVLVQLVIAAITTEPWCSTHSTSSITSLADDGRGGGGVSPACPPSPSHRPTGTALTVGTGAGFISVGNASANLRGTSRSPTRSCGRRGPAMLGSTVARLSSSVSL